MALQTCALYLLCYTVFLHGFMHLTKPARDVVHGPGHIVRLRMILCYLASQPAGSSSSEKPAPPYCARPLDSTRWAPSQPLASVNCVARKARSFSMSGRHLAFQDGSGQRLGTHKVPTSGTT